MHGEQHRSRPDFHPQVGRGPLVDRNTEGLPIGDFLYKRGKEKALQQAKYEEQERERSQPSTPRVGDVSRMLFHETKQRTYQALYEALTCQDPEGLLRAETMSVDGLSLDDEEMAALLRPVITYLQESGEPLSFDDFAEALELERRSSAVPTAGVLVRKGVARLRQGGGGDGLEEDLAATSSQRRASLPGPSPRARPRAGQVPWHEQLHRERELRENRLQERRLQRDEQELRECTFRPKVRARSTSSGRRSRRLSGLHSEASATLLGSSAELSRVSVGGSCSGQPPLPRTPASSRSGGPPGVLIAQLSLCSGSQSGSGPITPRQDVDELEPSIGDYCREQIDQVEQAVAHCKSVMAIAKDH